jgi:hypothetical protein
MKIARRVQLVKVLALLAPLALAACSSEPVDPCTVKKKGFAAKTEVDGLAHGKELLVSMKAKVLKKSEFELTFKNPEVTCKKPKVQAAAEEEAPAADAPVDPSQPQYKKREKKKAEVKEQRVYFECTAKITYCPIEITPTGAPAGEGEVAAKEEEAAE